jgi:hypothetical protein
LPVSARIRLGEPGPLTVTSDYRHDDTGPRRAMTVTPPTLGTRLGLALAGSESRRYQSQAWAVAAAAGGAAAESAQCH